MEEKPIRGLAANSIIVDDVDESPVAIPMERTPTTDPNNPRNPDGTFKDSGKVQSLRAINTMRRRWRKNRS